MCARRDIELEWKGTDDVGFARMVLDHLHAAPSDSVRWFGQYSKPIIDQNKGGEVSVTRKATHRDPGYGKF